MTAPDSAHGGPVPQTPWDFPPWRRRQKGRRTNDRPPAPEGLCPLHGPALGLRPRRALPSEPHKQGSTRRTPVLCFSQFPARQRRCADTKQEPLLHLSKAVLLSSTWGAAHSSQQTGRNFHTVCEESTKACQEQEIECKSLFHHLSGERRPLGTAQPLPKRAG